MADMDGQEFMQHVRTVDKETPFLFLTANEDLSTAVDLIKLGADDFISKPVVEDVLIFRLKHAVREREQARMIARIEQERELLELENRKLVSWRNLYAVKDIAQTQQMIQLLSRSINQAGGFMWIEILKDEMEHKTEDGSYRVSEAALRMALTAAEGQRQVFDFVTFIAGLDTMELDVQPMPAGDLVNTLVAGTHETVGLLESEQTRQVSFIQPAHPIQGTVHVSPDSMKEVMHELMVNAVKFSPKNSTIFVGFAETHPPGSDRTTLNITVRNTPVETTVKDREGNPVLGIPYDFSELVFDLFYSIEGFPIEIEAETWRYGTGLYICRHLINRQQGTISAKNGVDYTGGGRRAFVELLITLPIHPEQPRTSGVP